MAHSVQQAYGGMHASASRHALCLCFAWLAIGVMTFSCMQIRSLQNDKKKAAKRESDLQKKLLAAESDSGEAFLTSATPLNLI